ncbi:hypothetical protein J6TS1_19110 [Siminovitchia terrae]|uniref:Uncharacterized protein n=1 Tax=Siminovitchia terrae TaxID=1914933 RepID=A0ABQ4KWR6_SIMTE|nr:hypothetical protein J6TS1_19110 [Siminovitchia terrae]
MIINLVKHLDKSEDLDKINEFMFYDEGKLIGYIGICQFDLRRGLALNESSITLKQSYKLY